MYPAIAKPPFNKVALDALLLILQRAAGTRLKIKHAFFKLLDQ